MYWTLLVVLCGVILLILAYHIYICMTKFEVFKFAMREKGNWMPLLPFVGNTYVALFTGTKINMLSTLLWAEKYIGLPVNFWYGSLYHYMCDNAEEARIILNHPKCLDKAELYKDVHYMFRNSVLLVPGEEWKPRRRYLKTAFKTSMIKTYIPIFYQQSCSLGEELKQISPNQDIFKFFNKYAFLNFFLTAVAWQGDKIDPYVEKFGMILDDTQDEFVKLLINPLVNGYIFTRTPLGYKLKKFITEMKSIMKRVIKVREKQLENAEEYIEDPTELPLLDLLLSDAYEKRKESDVFEEFTLLAAAASDTTGHTLAFCFTLLGMHPEIQERLYEELVSVLGDHAIEEMYIPKLKYTEAVISETLRILPSVPLYGRYISEDIDLGTKVIPKGANFFVSSFHIHRNPAYWPNPLKFDPERFMPENVSKIIPGSYLPFSLGARNCIGQAMATTLTKLTVANVVRHFKIESKHKSVNEFQLCSCISMKTIHNLDCKFIPRNINNKL